MKLIKDHNYCTMWLKGSWNTCCYFHDEDFLNPKVSFLQANLSLFKCVKRKGGLGMATLMFIGVMSPVGYSIWLYNRWAVKTGRM